MAMVPDTRPAFYQEIASTGQNNVEAAMFL
jgi:hypothetical protein